MIENLNGIHETVNYVDRKAFRLYDNNEYENYPDHWHPEMELIMPIAGDYLVRVRETEYLVHPGEVIIIGSGVIHYLGAPGPGERIIFQPNNALLHVLPEMDNTMSLLPPVLHLTEESSGEILPQILSDMKAITEAYFSHRPLSETTIYQKTLDIFTLIGTTYYNRMPQMDGSFSRQNEHIETFMSICAYINEHCTDDLHLEAIAEMAGFSKFHFTRLFREYTGTTFYKYLNKKRIEKAEQLLVDPTIPIMEVAFSSGFASNSAFIRMFKQIKGCTPKEFRKMLHICYD